MASKVAIMAGNGSEEGVAGLPAVQKSVGGSGRFQEAACRSMDDHDWTCLMEDDGWKDCPFANEGGKA